MDKIKPLFTATATPEHGALVKEAHEKICPCSHGTRGDVDVSFEAVGS